MEREISKLREEKKRMMKQVEMAKLDAAAQRKKAAVAEMAVSSGSSSGAAPWLPVKSSFVKKQTNKHEDYDESVLLLHPDSPGDGVLKGAGGGTIFC